MNNFARNITSIVCVVAIATSCIVLAGWFFNIPLLKSLLPGWASMKFNTALCFILSGISLYLLDKPSVNKLRKSIAIVCACLVFLIGFLSISEYIFRNSLPIDELFWKSGTETGPVSFPGRMSELTAFNFTLLGFILLILKKKKYAWLVQALLFAIVPFSMITIFIYFFSAAFLTNIPLLTPTALHSAILFILLGAGVLYSSPLQYVGLSFQKKITAFFLLVSLLLGLIFYTYDKNQEKAIDTNIMLEHTHEVLFKAEELKDKANEMPSAIRGFIITGRDNDLQLFSNATDNMASIIYGLKTLTKDNAGQQLRIDTLETLIDNFIAFQLALVNIRRKEGIDAAQKVLLNGKSILLIGDLQSKVTAFVLEERQLLGKHKMENEQSIQNSSAIINVFKVFIALLLLIVLSIIYNNTRRRNKAEEQMKEYKYFFNNNNDLCGIANSEGYFETINTNFITTLGYTENEFCEIPFIELIHPDDIQETLHEYEKLKFGELVINFVNRYRVKNGDYLYLDWNATPNAATGKLYCVARNITERKKAEEALQNSLKEVSEYKNALQNQSQAISRTNAIIEFDLEGNILTANDNFLRLFGYSLPEIKDKHHRIIIKEGLENTSEYIAFWEHLKKGGSHFGEFERKSKDGQTIWILGSYNLIYDVEGKLVKVLKIVTDITDRKKLEGEIKQFNQELEQKIKERTEELSSSENRFKALVEHNYDIISLIDESFQIIYRSPSVSRVLGFAPEEMEALEGIENVHPEDREYASDIIQNSKSNPGKPVNATFRRQHKEGHYVWLEGVITNLLHDEKIKAYVTNFRDVTERVESGRALAASEETRRLIMNSALDAIVCIDSNGLITVWTLQAEKVFGWKEQEVLGKSLADTIIPLQYRSRHIKGLENYLRTGEGPVLNSLIEITAVNMDGIEFPVELSIVPFEQNGKAFFCGFIRDITERKKAEEKLKEYGRELQTSNTELERFAYVASHDLQEPLRMVASFLTLLEKRIDGHLDETSKQYIYFAVDGAGRMKKLIQDLLRYSRVGTNKEDFTSVDLTEVMQYTIRVLEESIKETGAQITVKRLPFITGNKTLFSQLFLNLVINALKYHRDKDPKIEIGCNEEAGKWIFYVKDNGIGIDAKYFDKIFIIFQRLHNKNEYSGTGIGLAICKKIVEIHKGNIWVESLAGEGSTFYFSIPKEAI
jgi:PAS domain S-box-containing protein